MASLLVGVAKTEKIGRSAEQAYHSATLTGLIRESIQQVRPVDQDAHPVMSGFIQPGMTVLMKPNWVLHYNQHNQGQGDLACMYTHPAFLLAALKEVIAAKPGRVMIGDAPVQGCSWEDLVTPQLRQQIEEAAGDCPVDVIDFRRTVVQGTNLVSGVQTGLREENRYIRFDLGSDSLLEPISLPPGRFRVTMYDPRELANTHAPGQHQYLVCREPFEADVILNLPKLKTHRKAGLTGALKNMVGINGNKDYLPHHRVGGTAWGGDCYPGLAPLKRLAEMLLDYANQNIGSPAYRQWKKMSSLVLKIHRVFGDPELEGGWYGNDTTWRMALDLNRILLYGRPDGTMSEEPQHRVWSLTDALVCGQGEGPLAPEPCYLGAVTFSDSSVAADWVHALLLGLDPQKIHQVREGFGDFRWPLASPQRRVEVAFRNQALREEKSIALLGTRAKPPRGWVGHCELV